MQNSKISYFYLLIIHVLIAFAIFVIPFLSKIYALLIPLIGFWVVNKSKNSNNAVLFVASYLVGVEVFLRMTGGNFNNEYIKFSVVFFMITGMVHSNFSTNALVFGFFLILLVPGILLTFSSENLSIDVKKSLVFNLSGPVCLGISAIYMFRKRITFSDLQNILIAMGLPILTTTTYLFLYNPSVRDVVTGTQSNFETSGGFGPNQVSTILGLGIFIFFTQFLLFSKTKKIMIVNGLILLFISYRGIVTFSRGGIIAGVIMVSFLLIILFLVSNAKGKGKFILVFIVTGLMGIGIWTYSSMQTNGLIEKRYANQDARGKIKKSKLSGREEIMESEIKLFLNNPITGVGAGVGKEMRKKDLGGDVASHNEITRLLAEHGVFGIIAFVILFITPLIMYINNRQHLYFFPFFIFWFLTINHAAMRIAAPAFVYALTLLSVQFKIPEKIVDKTD